MTLEALLKKSELALFEKCKPISKNYRTIILTTYVIRSRLLLNGIMSLVKAEIWTETAPLLHSLFEIRARSMVLCSPYGEFACDLLRWFEELQKRLHYLQLSHLDQFSNHQGALLSQINSQEGKKLITEWFAQKPKPHTTSEEWLSHWYSWNLQRLFIEIQKNLIESPRIKKEMATLLEFALENEPSATLAGVKRYALIDEEFNAVTFLSEGESKWKEGPVSLSTAAILDMLSEISDTFELSLEKEIETYRKKMLSDFHLS